MKLKGAALIGIGYWGKVHLKYLQKIKKISINKIYFHKNKKILNDKSIKLFNLTSKLQDILNDKSISFVDIVTPIDTHADLAIKFLKTGKKVLVEKPLIFKKKEEKILKKYKNNLIVSYPYLFSKSLNFAKKIITSKSLGKLKFIEINIQQCGRFMKYGVNHLLGPHALSILSVFFDVRDLKIIKYEIIKKKNIETSIINVFKKQQLVSSINLSLNYASEKNIKIIKIFCGKGTIVCDLNDKDHTIKSSKYIVKAKKNFKVGKIIKHKFSFFDEKNNMKEVIKNFISKKNSNNFVLTQKINKFLNNG